MTPTPSIFIAEDDPDDRQIISDAFRETNAAVEIVFVENGNKLIDLLNTPDIVLPSLVLLDLNMPGLQGLQVLKKLKKDKKTAAIPVIIFTTSIRDSDRVVSYELGANCFIAKPESFSELIQITRSILRLWFRDQLVVSDTSDSAVKALSS